MFDGKPSRQETTWENKLMGENNIKRLLGQRDVGMETICVTQYGYQQ